MNHEQMIKQEPNPPTINKLYKSKLCKLQIFSRTPKRKVIAGIYVTAGQGKNPGLYRYLQCHQ